MLGPYREGQIKAIGRVQKKVAKFANHANECVWAPLAQRRKIARICALFKAYTGERAWISKGGRSKGPRYLSRDDHDRKIRARKQRTDIGKYCFVNWITKLWNKLPAGALATFACKLHIFRKRVKKVIVRRSEKWGVMCSDVK